MEEAEMDGVWRVLLPDSDAEAGREEIEKGDQRLHVGRETARGEH